MKEAKNIFKNKQKTERKHNDGFSFIELLLLFSSIILLIPLIATRREINDKDIKRIMIFFERVFFYAQDIAIKSGKSKITFDNKGIKVSSETEAIVEKSFSLPDGVSFDVPETNKKACSNSKGKPEKPITFPGGNVTFTTRSISTSGTIYFKSKDLYAAISLISPIPLVKKCIFKNQDWVEID